MSLLRPAVVESTLILLLLVALTNVCNSFISPRSRVNTFHLPQYDGRLTGFSSQIVAAKKAASAEGVRNSEINTAPKNSDRPVQILAFAKIEEALFSPQDKRSTTSDPCRRATVVMPGGSGKTRVGLRAVQRALQLADGDSGTVSRVLVLVPRLALIEQTVREYMREGHDLLEDWPSQTLCVCSSLDVPLTHTTSPEVIAGHLNKTGGKHNKLLVFATYASVKNLEVAAREVQNPFSLVVLDEAHFTAGKGDDSGRALHEY
mmetsp:Transcript_57827/g.113831  ORF Transcript_57827/g.113831 Transcript_57827/m.113831 type:complete len:261 (+) Transcript_57827:123-905(+)